LDSQQKKALGINSGIIIEKAEGASARAGLQAEDVILTINNQDVDNAQDFKKIIEKDDSNKSVVVLARRGNITQYIAIKKS